MTQTTVYLTIPQNEAIASCAKDTGLKQSEIIRRALDEYLEKYQAKKQASASK